MSSVLHRSPVVPPLAGQTFETAYEWRYPKGDPRANRHVEDMSSGAGVACLGLQQHDVMDAITVAVEKIPYAHSAQWTTESIENAASVMVGSMGPTYNGGACVFYSSGSEAIEAACKIAAQVASWRGRTIGLIARKHSYHGNTMFSLMLGDHPRKHTLSAFSLTTIDGVARVPTFSREFYEHDSVGRVLTVTAAAAELCVQHGQVPVIVVEPIGGTTIGISPPPLEYLIGLAKIREETGAILIYDEVLCGNWRTGHMAAWQHYQRQLDGRLHPDDGPFSIAPDIVVMGKGIAAGYFPISCVIVQAHVRSAVEHLGRLWHTTTNQNHPVGCAGVIAAQRIYRNFDASDLLDELATNTIPALRTLPHVHWVTGIGTLWGIQLNPTIPGLHAMAKLHLRNNGFAVYSDGGTVMKPPTGAFGNMLLLAPPFNMDPAVLDDFVEALATFKY